MPLVLLIQQVASFIEAGITTYKQVKSAAKQAKVQITESDGRVISADDLRARLDALIAHGGEVGDNAAGRIG